MAKEKSVFINSEIGEFRYLSLDKENVIKGKGTGKQTGSIVFEGAALKKMTDVIEEFIADSVPAKQAKTVTRPFKTDKKTGKIYLPFKRYLTTQEGDPIVIPVVDKGNNVVKNRSIARKIGNGSKGRVRVGLRITEFGGDQFVQVTLFEVKLLKLVEGSPSGFGEDDSDFDEDGAFSAGEFADEDEGGHEQSNASPDDRDDDEIPF